jgi:predicted nucleic acid-binding protein
VIALDTNVLSELMRDRPAQVVVDWAASQSDELVTTAVSVAEVRYGLRRLPEGRRRDELTKLADGVLEEFSGQVLPFDARAARLYGDLVARRERQGSAIDGFDAQVAATCLAHGSALATRNARDFRDLGLVLIDPWHES